jgi:hypothetical protein
MDAGTLGAAISEVCPIISCTVGKSDDRSTWSYEPEAQATAPQKAAADNVIATIPIETPSTLATVEWIGRFTNAEYRAATAAAWRSTAGNAKNWDVVAFADSVNMGKKSTVTLRDSLVTDGILTQARADEIFK